MTTFNPAPSPDPASVGTTVTICFEDESRAGETVTISISNQAGLKTTKEIKLDADGKGCVGWDVPEGWAGLPATISEPNRDAYSLAISD